MVDEPGAREIAEGKFDGKDVLLGPAQELNDGWFFPCVAKRTDFVAGVIVNKKTGQPLRILTDSALDRDPALYDRGYHFHMYDLVVLTVTSVEETVRVLHALNEVTEDKYYKNDRVYRVGRALTEAEVRERISNLPCVFSGRFELHVDTLEQAREAGWFSFKTFEYRGKK
ncbi:hypothetical protein [Mycolicibacterium vinylchloridicum]|uniref:hypothetical protein n=1 Tax=Mycolicibacterium vinylchloridicum TaxID=2736928 RepID=UPI0015CBFF30|nr:hypothetical protein [Mycolicibacterium vinylchloridicum]